MEEISLLSYKDSKSPLVEAYRNIRTNINFANATGKKIKTIVLSSSFPNEGKSTVIANLAILLAQAGNKVALIDCDLRNPTLHKLFKLHNTGVTNFMMLPEGDLLSFAKVNVVENLAIICAGPIPPNPSEILGSEKMKEVLATLSAEFDYILLDAPPILPVTDAVVLSGVADATIMVIASGHTSPKAAQDAKTRLEQGGANLIGVVLNKVDIESSSYGKGYGYYYYYGEKEK